MKRPYVHQKSAPGTLLFWAGYLLNLWLALGVASKATIWAGKAFKVPPGGTLAFAVAGVLLVGGTVFWLLSRLRAWPLRHHLKGWQLMEQQRFAEAIPEFEASYQWFSRHPWLDRLRAPLLLDPSGISTRESALLNIAHCHDLLEDRPSAEAAYRRVLEEFPESPAARLSLHWRKQLSGENPPGSETPDDARLCTVQCSGAARLGIGLLFGVPLGLSIVDALNAPSHRLALAAAWGTCFLVYAGVRSRLLRHLHQGVMELRSRRYAEAIAAFEAQDALVVRHPWLDRYRAAIFLWASSMSVRETVQVNIGLCHVRMGDRDRAEAQYRKVLESFPDSVMAHDALRIIRSMAA
ncbi:MAG: tetratricopeptide repeat protein [Nitrospirota bacterium]|nr:tetratricopeptide repeat protein [Nitrospirota bacterium]